jgi:hypothetical protein
MDNNLLLAILGELKLASITPLVTHEIAASGITYIIYRKRQISDIDGYLVMKVTVSTDIAETTTIETAFLPWLTTSVYDVTVYDTALEDELNALSFG